MVVAAIPNSFSVPSSTRFRLPKSTRLRFTDMRDPSANLQAASDCVRVSTFGASPRTGRPARRTKRSTMRETHMPRMILSALTVLLVLVLAPVMPQQAFGPPSMQAGQAPTVEPVKIPLDLFRVPDGFEVTLWASTPLLHNPTNIDIDRDGRIWVAEGVRYRQHTNRQPEGDRIVVLEDTDGDGKADKKWTFVQEPGLISPLGVSVIDNKVIVSQPPDLIVYTDVDRNQRFDPAVDKREVLLTGFMGI